MFSFFGRVFAFDWLVGLFVGVGGCFQGLEAGVLFVLGSWIKERLTMAAINETSVEFKGIPISGTFLISPRSALRPPLAAANVLSHSLSSARKSVDWETMSGMATVAIIAYCRILAGCIESLGITEGT